MRRFLGGSKEVAKQKSILTYARRPDTGEDGSIWPSRDRVKYSRQV
jgi:hypothetical protein